MGRAEFPGRRHFKTAIAGTVFVALLTIIVGRFVYSAPPARSTVAEHNLAAGYDGITLYKSLYFAHGPLVSKIPTLQKLGANLPAEYRQLEPQVINYIEQHNLGFFDRFAREIQSGNRAQVAEALKSAHRINVAAFAAVTKNSNSPFATRVARLQAGSAAAEPQSPAVDSVVEVIAQADFCAAIVLIAHFAIEKSQGQSLQGLTVDRYVDEIVRAVPKAELQKPPIRAPSAARP